MNKRKMKRYLELVLDVIEAGYRVSQRFAGVLVWMVLLMLLMVVYIVSAPLATEEQLRGIDLMARVIAGLFTWAWFGLYVQWLRERMRKEEPKEEEWEEGVTLA